MLPLQWVAAGLVLVVLDVYAGGYDVLADWVGWLLALGAVLALRARLGSGPAVAAAVSLVVAALGWVPGLLRVDDTSLAWALSLPQAVFCVLLALRLAALLPDQQGILRAAGVTNAVVALLPVVVLGGGLTAVVGPLAFAAVAAVLWLCFLLVSVAPAVPRTPAA
ncbi:hypothetical protein [Nocardioides aequoreus]|uniref:hypothetical protein n=1 Tax=Nocardioides aequoreus TaxID=397278 RepID=UPI0012F6E1FB|nr:hypothetical protein [Nocardioides aequoreus]